MLLLTQQIENQVRKEIEEIDSMQFASNQEKNSRRKFFGQDLTNASFYTSNTKASRAKTEVEKFDDDDPQETLNIQ